MNKKIFLMMILSPLVMQNIATTTYANRFQIHDFTKKINKELERVLEYDQEMRSALYQLQDIPERLYGFDAILDLDFFPLVKRVWDSARLESNWLEETRRFLAERSLVPGLQEYILPWTKPLENLERQMNQYKLDSVQFSTNILNEIESRFLKNNSTKDWSEILNVFMQLEDLFNSDPEIANSQQFDDFINAKDLFLQYLEEKNIEAQILETIVEQQNLLEDPIQIIENPQPD